MNLQMFNFLYNNYWILTIIISLLLGSSVWFFFTFLIRAIASPPPRQFMYTINFLNGLTSEDKEIKEKTKKAQKKNEKMEKRDKHKQLKSEFEQDKKETLIAWVTNSYKRLGILKTYEDFEAEVNSYKFMVIAGVSSLVVLLVLVTGLFALVLLLIPVLLFAENIASMFAESDLRSKISKLNYRQKIELPLLISRFVAIATKANENACITVIQGYLPHAGYLKEDLALVVSDMVNLGQTEALNNWVARISIGDTKSETMEIISFIEKIKKLYSKGDEIYCKSEMSALIRTLDEKYMKKFRDKASDSKYLMMQLMVVLNFFIVCFFFCIPMIISIMEGMKAIQ